ncbi:MAG TPA: threonine ammonia-lyase [Capillimicrobium sp.]|nr:threonine ammonia-lyase [Capillimicrobium sp.]
MSTTATVTAADVARVRPAVDEVVRRTPVLGSQTLSARLGGDVMLKAESLQRTGSFKIRGALAKLHALGDACAAGVVCGSAGNHAQALAGAARIRGVPCQVVMPADAPIAKAEGAEQLGATVVLEGDNVEAALAVARERAERHGLTFVHPFDDPDVIAGQGTLGLELLEDVPDLAKVIVPVGGGGLASGVALAVKSARPEVEVVGVQVDTFPAVEASLAAGHPVEVSPALTIADGIAVKRPGEITLPLLERWLDGVAVVAEDDVATAMVMLLEKAKLVVEGAGAVGLAALLAGRVRPAERGATVIVLSGGNVDVGLLAHVARHEETEAGRRLALITRMPDRPGNLARLLHRIADAGANVVEVQHVREGIGLHVRETAVQLVLETRGPAHADAVLEAIAAAGYDARVLR